MTYFVQLICDYAPGDLAWAEVFSAFAARLPDTARMHFTTVASFDTIGTGFTLAQLGMAEATLRPENLIIFANCAPRKDTRLARPNNEGEGLLFTTLKNGVQILAVNSGYSLSFVKSDIQELWSTNAQEQGSQFRSRDYFPEIVGLAARGDYSYINHRLDIESTIPDPPKEVIGYVDSFGNLKTTYRIGDDATAHLTAGSRLKVQIGSTIRTATVATGSFSVMEGDLAFAPGSSGHERRYWELFQRGGSAWIEYRKPATGSKVVIEMAKLQAFPRSQCRFEHISLSFRLVWLDRPALDLAGNVHLFFRLVEFIQLSEHCAKTLVIIRIVLIDLDRLVVSVCGCLKLAFLFCHLTESVDGSDIFRIENIGGVELILRIGKIAFSQQYVSQGDVCFLMIAVGTASIPIRLFGALHIMHVIKTARQTQVSLSRLGISLHSLSILFGCILPIAQTLHPLSSIDIHGTAATSEKP